MSSSYRNMELLGRWHATIYKASSNKSEIFTVMLDKSTYFKDVLRGISMPVRRGGSSGSVDPPPPKFTKCSVEF